MAHVTEQSHDSDHVACDPDTCFTAKLRYWRSHGAPGVIFGAPGRRDDFHNTTFKALAEQQVAEAKAAGLSPEPVGTRWYAGR